MPGKPQIKDIFFEAVKLETPQSRDRYLDDACGDDGDLRRRVEALLAAHNAPESYLDRPAAEFQLEATDDPSSNSERPDRGMVERPGSVIGPYKLLEQIGEGGMGVVFMAEQQKPVRRKVALKIIKPGMDTKQVIARFEAERQALAIMNHSNIAHVLDAGSTESGRPYFVMELVRGIPISQYCDQNKLSTTSRLELFVSVCQAVQHAHTKGIIHRDIKPTNVLVTLHDGVPVPKIIDFGVAKATSQQLTEKTLFTAFAQMVGTPLYMSPEQAEMSGLDIDTRSDIYSLGVLLYELLTGTTPFDKQRIYTAAYDEVRRIIREEEPAKPSMRISTLGENSAAVCKQRSTDANKLSLLLRGELDWIVMTSLEKDRTRRYQTASALAEDVLHHLSGEAVKACPPTLGYRAGKFVKRYRTQVAVGSLFLLLLVVSSAAAWILFVNARQARNDAFDATAKAFIDRENAVAAKDELEREKNRAEENYTLAEQERQRAESLAEQRQRTLYNYNLIKAATAYRENDTSRAVEFLDECLEEQRGWEWRRLQRLTEAERILDVSEVPITWLDVSRLDSRIVTVDGTGRLQLCDPDNGRIVWSRDTGIESPLFMKFSGSGKLIAVASHPMKLPGRLQVWEAATGKIVWETKSEQESFVMAEFSNDAQYLAISRIKLGKSALDTRPSVELFDLSRQVQVWQHPCRGLPFPAFAPDAKHLYVSLAYGAPFGVPSRLCCWALEKPTGPTEIWRVERSTTSIPTPTPDGSQLITGGPHHSIQIWDAASGLKIDELPGGHSDAAFYTVFSLDGRYVASRGISGTIAVWDWRGKRELPSLRTRCNGMLGPAFTADGAYVVLGSKAGTGVELRVVAPDPPQLTLRGHEQMVNGVSFSPNGQKILSASWDGTLRTWSTATGQELKIQDAHTSAHAVAHSPKGDFIATSGPDGVKLWDAETRDVLHRWATLSDAGWIDFTPHGDQVVVGDGKNLMVWDVADGQPLHSFQLAGAIGGLALSADGHSAVSLVYQTGQLDIWNLESGDNQELRAGSENVRAGALALCPQSNMIAAAINGKIELWDLDRDQLVASLTGHDKIVECLAFNGDGSRLFSGDTSGVIKVWVCETGEQLLNMQAHEPFPHPERGMIGVRSLAVSPDGSTLASAGADALVKLWETTRPPHTVANQRRVVAQATQAVNERYRQSGSHPAVLQSLRQDVSLTEDVLATAVEIANTRGDRPWVAGNTRPPTADKFEIDDVRQAIVQARKALIEFVEFASGADIEAGTGSLPGMTGSEQWRDAAARIADPAFLSLEELNYLLNPLIEAYPRAHQFVYIRGLAHAGRGRWEEAEADLATALSRVPEKSDLWHTQAYRLAFLYVYLGHLDRYQDLCEKTLADFGDTNSSRLAERTSKMCLFSSLLCVDVEQAAQLADGAMKDDIPPSLDRWYFLAQGIAHYRRGNWSSAIENLHRSRNGPPLVLHRTLAFLYEALARERSGDGEKAREALAAAEEIMNRVGFPQKESAGFAASWSDWINVQVVYEEAQQLLRDAEQSGDRPLPPKEEAIDSDSHPTRVVPSGSVWKWLDPAGDLDSAARVLCTAVSAQYKMIPIGGQCPL